MSSCGGISYDVKRYTEQSDSGLGAKALCATLVELANQTGIK